MLLAFGGAAQTSNPFDLQWRNKRPTTLTQETEKDTLLNDTLSSGEFTDTSRADLPLADLTDSGTTSGTEPTSDYLDSESSSMRENKLVGSKQEEPVTNPSIEAVTKADDFISSDIAKDNSDISGISGKDPDNQEANISLPADEAIRTPLKNDTNTADTIGLAMFLAIFGLALIILIWAVNINRGFIQKIYRAALNKNFSALLLREQRFASAQYLYYIVYIVFFLNAGLFLYLISRYASWDFGHRGTPVMLFLTFFILVYAVKHSTIRLLGKTFMISKEMKHYNFNIILYNILVGIILMPVNLFLAFGPTGLRMPLIYTGLALIALMYILRQFRGMVIGSHLIVKNVFQFFVYLCAIEILPVLVLFKFFPN